MSAALTPPRGAPDGAAEAPAWRPGQVLLAALAVWAAFGVADHLRNYYLFTLTQQGEPFPWVAVALERMGDGLAWILLAPGIVRLAQRRPVQRERWAQRLLLHCAAGAAVASLVAGVNTAVSGAVGRPIAYTSLLGITFHYNFLTYAAVAAVAHLVEYGRRTRERAVRLARLEAELAAAQLGALKAQLEPHFLFNTLGSLAELIHESPDDAERMVQSLEELLRLTLAGSPAPEVTLREEMRMLDAYLQIQQTRFRDRLAVETQVDPAVLEARVPALLLQPLVENAIRHGLAPRAAPGRIRVAVRREGGTLRAEVQDDGVGLPPDGRVPREGVGLANTRVRLARLYGEAQRFEVRSGEGGGTVASVVLPFRTAEVERFAEATA